MIIRTSHRRDNVLDHPWSSSASRLNGNHFSLAARPCNFMSSGGSASNFLSEFFGPLQNKTQTQYAVFETGRQRRFGWQWYTRADLRRKASMVHSKQLVMRGGNEPRLANLRCHHMIIIVPTDPASYICPANSSPTTVALNNDALQ
jgi:hypothetical protein